MKIEAATQHDVSAIANILSHWNATTTWMPRKHSRAAEKYFARMMVSRGWVTVARQGTRLVGFLARDGQEVHALYVAVGMRRYGVGKLLLDAAKSDVKALGLFTFTANEGAQRFYLREGFHERGRTDGLSNDEGLPDIRYEWSQDQ